MHPDKQKNSPYNSLLFPLTLILILFLSSLTAYGASTETDIPVRIGVLAKRGADYCRSKWTPTIDYLSANIEGYSFSLQPLTFKQIEPAVEKQEIDFLHSTDHYPEWPLAKLYHTDNRLAELVAISLINMPSTSQAARQGSYYGWTIPLNCQTVHDCLKSLKEPPYENYGKQTLVEVFFQHRLTIAGIAAVLLLLLMLSLKLAAANRRLELAVTRMREETAKRLETQTTLQKSQTELASLFQSSPIGIGIMNGSHDRRFNEINKQFCKMVGYTREELLGKSGRLIYPSDDEYERVGRMLYGQLKEQKVASLEARLQRKDGKIIDTLLRLAPLKPEDLSAGKTFTVTDITAIKNIERQLIQSENKFRSMMESMNDAVYICSKDYHVEYMNPAMIARTGRNATGEFCYQAIHGLTQPCRWCKGKDKEQGMYFDSDIVSPKDKRYYHVSDSPVTNENGSVSSMIVFRDTTDMKKLEQQLRQSHKLEAVGTLAGGIAHDFNNILAGILGFAEIAQRNIPADSETYDDINEVIIGANRAAALVKQILALSRKSMETLEPLKPHRVIKEAIKLLRASLPATVSIEEDIDPESGEILADQAQVHQIIMNLCTNAFHALENEKGVINFKLKRAAVSLAESAAESEVKPGPFVVMSVSDNGCGMDQDLLEYIFDPYFTTKDLGKGSGLGLAVIHGIVKKYHEVTATTDSRKALELVRNQPDQFDLVVTNQSMPNLAGFELAREVLKIKPAMPIILCTGYSAVVSEEEALAIGIRKYLFKPVDTVTLAQVVRQTLNEG